MADPAKAEGASVTRAIRLRVGGYCLEMALDMRGLRAWLAVLIALAEKADEHRRVRGLDYAAIAERAEISRTATFHAIRKLQRDGLLEVIPTGAGRGAIPEYHLSPVIWKAESIQDLNPSWRERVQETNASARLVVGH